MKAPTQARLTPSGIARNLCRSCLVIERPAHHDNRRKQKLNEEKVIRAYGECLGTDGRRRAQQAAKSCGEAQAAIDPQIPEWGNPAGAIQSPS